jgi:uncharacterized protein (TIGR03089 family)
LLVKMLVADLLRARLRVAGADPLVTYYDVGKGERVELSAVTFANWVAKTANLLSLEVSTAPGDAVALPLALSAPGHWMTAIWEVALWQTGAYVDLTADAHERAAVVVCGPDWQPYAEATADVLACSLHPFATGLGAGLPPSVIDVDLAIRAQPDSYTPVPVDPTAVAWVDGPHRWSQADLSAGPAGSTGTAGSASATESPGRADSTAPTRRLIVPSDPWSTAQEGIIAALRSGGSVVVVVGGSAGDQAKIGTAEHAVVG